MNHIDFFTGIGGFTEAARRVGWNNLLHCEIEEYPRKILKQNYPKSESHTDIRSFDGRPYRGAVDVVSGGWPCQDNSKAKQWGKGQLGLEGERSGLLFELCRVVREMGPGYLVTENVPDILTINGGRDFNRILCELAAMGYNATWGVLRASDIGAPHHRARLYMVAYTHGIRFPPLVSVWRDVRKKIITGTRVLAGATVSVGGTWRESESVFLRMDDGIPDRAHRIKALGNSVVPEIPYHIFKAIQEHKNQRLITHYKETRSWTN